MLQLKITYQWLSARLQCIHGISNGDTAILHQAIDIFEKIEHAFIELHSINNNKLQ